VFMSTGLWLGCVTGRLLFLGNDANAPKLGEVKGVGYFWYWFMFNWWHQLYVNWDASITMVRHVCHWNLRVNQQILAAISSLLLHWILSYSCFRQALNTMYMPYNCWAAAYRVCNLTSDMFYRVFSFYISILFSLFFLGMFCYWICAVIKS